MKIEYSILILVTFSFCNSAELIAGDVTDKLPSIFSPLTWATHPDEVKSLFPNHEITEDKYPVRINNRLVEVNAIFVTQRNRPYFGDTFIAIEHVKNQITGIRMHTADTRKECVPPVEAAPKYCRGNYGEKLKTTLFNIKDALEKKYSKATIPLISSDYQSNHKQYFYIWEFVGYGIYLNLTTDEEDYWAVTLSAVKNKF